MFQIDWKANPPIRRFGEKREDQPEREATGDSDWHHDKRFWKRWIDRRGRLIENCHIRKCQLALQLSLFGRPFPAVKLFGAKRDVALQFAEPVALPLNLDQRLLGLLLLGLKRSDLGLHQADAVFQMQAHFVGRVANLLAKRGEIRLLGQHLWIAGA